MKLTGETKLLLAMGAFVLLGGGFLFLSNRGAEGGPSPQATATPPPPTVTRAQFDDLVKSGRHVKGDPNAKLTIIEFADFQCPSCRRAYASVSQHFGKTIPARLVFYHMPLVRIHERAMPAAIASEAAAKQGKFWEMYDDLFEGTPTEPHLSADDIDKDAQRIGLNMDQFHNDLKDSAALQSLIEADQKKADAIHVDETPTFLVVTTKDAKADPQVFVGAQKMEEGMSALLGKSFAPASPAVSPTPAASPS